ncbi:MAG: hypothetical protein GY900_04235 [Actinomycetia bacterium]|jgi:hypothetical protein|nr:hypothetical protein [Actinomycetales bacterium]MCP4850928.1 hypothetical protein [Actinomycetes bacterium]
MASNASAIPLGPNFQGRAVKVPSLRLSNVGSSSTADYAAILVGDGVPSGAYGRDSGATMLYVRTDASSADTCLYVTPDGGTTWTAAVVAS